MKLARQHIQQRQEQFAESRFFRRLSSKTTAAGALAFVPGMTFFVMTFQDILRLNESRVQDLTLRAIVHHHRREDSGHDLWFLQDLAAIDGGLPDVRTLFSPTDTVTRDVAFGLMSEVFRATDDRVRITIPLVLEATGHVFFNHVVAYLDRISYEVPLKYFARGHLDVELSHELFEREMNAVLESLVMTDKERAPVLGMIDRSFDLMTSMLDALDERTDIGPPVSTTLPRSKAVATSSPAFAAIRRAQ